MKYNKINALLQLNNKTMSDLARYKKVSRQQLSNKKKNDNFTAEELIQAAIVSGTRLAYIDENNNPLIIFDESDIKNKPTE